MRLVIWSEFFRPYIGGVERSAAILLPELQKLGYEMMIVTSHHYLALPDAEIWQGIPLYRFDFSRPLSNGDPVTWMHQQKRLARLFDEFEPQLYHIFHIGPSVMALLQLMRRQPAPLISSLVNMPNLARDTFSADSAFGKTLRVSTWIITVSQGILERTVSDLPQLESHISVLRYGHIVPAMAPAPLAMPPRILFLGRLIVEKRADLAISAFQQIYQRYPDAQLLLAGDGPQREICEKLALEMGDRVEFLGWVEPSDIYPLLNSVTMVIMPSFSEGLPLSAIESAMAARPLICSRIPGLTEIVVDGETGILVEPGDTRAMAIAMAMLLDDLELATRMGLAARERAVEHFGVKRFVEEHDTLYQRIAGITTARTEVTEIVEIS